MTENHAQITGPRRGLSREEAAAYVGVSATTFDRAVRDKVMPKCFRLFGRVLWDMRDLDVAIDRLKGIAVGVPANDVWSRVAA